MTQFIELFISFVKVGSFSFGGAYSLIPLIEKEVVQNHSWLSQDDFLKVNGMAEVSPGAISIKFATYTGHKVAGIPGAFVANLGKLIMPSAIIMIAAYFYTQYEKNATVVKAFNGIKYAMIGIIVAIMYHYAVANFVEVKSIIFLALGASLVLIFNLHPAFVVIIAGIWAIIIL
jgi:chromate transporter